MSDPRPPETSQPQAQPQDGELRMPDRAALVAEAIARFDVLGRRAGRPSNVLWLDTKTLEFAGLLLTDRKLCDMDAYKQLCLELGFDSATADPETEPPVNYQALHRWAQAFRRVYAQVRGEHARRIARLSVESATQENIQTMSRVAHARLTEMMTEKLIDSDSLEDLSPSEINSMLSAIDGVTNAQIKREELTLKIEKAEREKIELEDKLKKSELDRAKLAQQIDGLKSQFDAQAKSLEGGDVNIAKAFEEARKALFGQSALPVTGAN